MKELPTGVRLRSATAQDAAIIAAHRRAMFASMDPYTDAALNEMAAQFLPQVQDLLEREMYIGYLLETENEVVAGAGVMREIRLARPNMAPTERGYVGNVWVDENFRRRGLARWLMEHLMTDCQRRNIRELWLYASDMGRPLYEELGFTPSRPLQILLPEK